MLKTQMQQYNNMKNMLPEKDIKSNIFSFKDLKTFYFLGCIFNTIKIYDKNNGYHKGVKFKIHSNARRVTTGTSVSKRNS